MGMSSHFVYLGRSTGLSLACFLSLPKTFRVPQPDLVEEGRNHRVIFQAKSPGRWGRFGIFKPSGWRQGKQYCNYVEITETLTASKRPRAVSDILCLLEFRSFLFRPRRFLIFSEIVLYYRCYNFSSESDWPGNCKSKSWLPSGNPSACKHSELSEMKASEWEN